MRFNVRFHVPLALLLTASSCLPSTAFAQSVCEGMTTILEALEEREELEFFTLPGATCTSGYGQYMCDWPRPHHGGRGAPLRKWLRGVIVDVKNLAGEIHKCIEQEALPHDWRSFRKDRLDSGETVGYYVYTKDRPKMSIVVCVELGDTHEENSLRLVVHRGHKDYCL